MKILHTCTETFFFFLGSYIKHQGAQIAKKLSDISELPEIALLYYFKTEGRSESFTFFMR